MRYVFIIYLFIFNDTLMKQIQNKANPDENSDLPIDFKNLKKKIHRPTLKLLSNGCDRKKKFRILGTKCKG
jgi:hypothetical protein